MSMFPPSPFSLLSTLSKKKNQWEKSLGEDFKKIIDEVFLYSFLVLNLCNPVRFTLRHISVWTTYIACAQ